MDSEYLEMESGYLEKNSGYLEMDSGYSVRNLVVNSRHAMGSRQIEML